MYIENGSVRLTEVLERAKIFAIDNRLSEINVYSILYGMATTECLPKYILIANKITPKLIVENIYEGDRLDEDITNFYIEESKEVKHLIESYEYSIKTRNTFTFFVYILRNVDEFIDVFSFFFDCEISVDKVLNSALKCSYLFAVSSRKSSFLGQSEDYEYFANEKDKLYVELMKACGKTVCCKEENKVDENGNASLVKNAVLDSFAINISQMAALGKIGKVIGRDAEIQRIIDILSKSMKNSPVLLGEAGIGKTATVEGLALRIASGNVPDTLKNKIIYSLDLAMVLSGASLIGMLEERVSKIIAEVKKQKNIILFIDEIHMIYNDRPEGGNSLDIGNMIKAPLARGEITIIGATTLEEYRKTIEKDAALERRLQPIILDAPTPKQTFDIVYGIKSRFEKHHNIEISEDNVWQAINLAERYITDRNFPDKAIDLIDEACSSAKASVPCAQKLSKDDIKKVVARWKGVNVSDITDENISAMEDARNHILSEVFGQTEAVNRILGNISMAQFGIMNKNRPLSSFLLLGGTGVGKTFIAKQIAKHVVRGSEHFVRLDMSEFMEEHSVSKIIGSPPGYVGFDSYTSIAERIRRRPFSVVLFDEVDKAHSSVLNILLQILDEGCLTDSHARKIDFTKCIIILTANIRGIAKIGFNQPETSKDALISGLKENIKPEIIDRLDDVIVLKELTEDVMQEIAKSQLKELEQSLKAQSYNLSIDSSAIQFVANQPKVKGARAIRQTIKESVTRAIMDDIVCGKIKKDCAYIVQYDEEEKCIKIVPTGI